MNEDVEKETIFQRLTRIAKRYFIAIWTVGLTFIVTLLLSTWVAPDVSPFFFIAVMISAWRGGLAVGFFATLLTALLDIFVFLPTPDSGAGIDSGDLIQVFVDIAAALVVGTLSASKRKSEEDREDLLRREQTARIEAEKANKVKDEFLAAVSHELRTPLATIKTLTRFLLRKNPSEDERREYLEDIASECDRQIDLVHNLLDLSRIEAGGLQIKLSPIEASEVIEACEKIERVAATEKKHTLSIETPEKLPLIYADHSALRRALCSIVENAIKYTPDGGAIKISAFLKNTDRLIIEISDNGIGIADFDLPRVFESFYRGKSAENKKALVDDRQEVPGIGLGLYLARVLIDGMNGTIRAKSAINQGSSFSLELPVYNEKINSEEEPIAPDTAS